MFAKAHWWKHVLGLFVLGASGVLFMGVQTYREAPPLPDFVGPDGTALVSRATILEGQLVFQRYALMEHGTLFGDGGYRGPDYTAESLHEIARAMNGHYAAQLPPDADASARAAVEVRVQHEIKANTYDAVTNTVRLNDAQARAVDALVALTQQKFTGAGPEAHQPAGYIQDERELRSLAGFFFWGGWVCGTLRPGTDASYTQNWPYDPLAGNRATSGALFWSVLGSFTLILALGLVLYAWGKSAGKERAAERDREPPATREAVDALGPTRTQRATYKFFAVAAVLFGVQVLSGVLTVHDYVDFTTFFGHDIRGEVPLTVVRSWHVQLAVLWISTCWIAGSIFLLPRIAQCEPRGQLTCINVLFALLVAVVAGTVAGTWLGPMGFLGEHWRTLGHQGWEFVELGKLWQVALFAALILWAVIVFRGVRPALSAAQPFSLPSWMLYAVGAIVMLFLSSFVAQPTTNFVVADFWRWMVIHMWAECFFEVFTTVIVACFLVHMGLIGREAASRVVFFAVLLFCGSGFLGISHNFYWNAKPEATLAVGAIFSTLQVVPLVLLTLEAWKLRRMPGELLRNTTSAASFGQSDAFRFLLGVNFWNFVGAGVLGFIINLPIVNYYEHGTYLTVNHGHAALMGVYGNLSLAAILFCSRHIVRAARWNSTLLRASFWSLNLGLALMVVLDLFPAGLLQLQATLERGLWYSRSQTWLSSAPFQTLTWMRIVGGALFVLGGLVPFVWFMLTRWRSLREATALAPAVGRDEVLVPRGDKLARTHGVA